MTAPLPPPAWHGRGWQGSAVRRERDAHPLPALWAGDDYANADAGGCPVGFLLRIDEASVPWSEVGIYVDHAGNRYEWAYPPSHVLPLTDGHCVCLATECDGACAGWERRRCVYCGARDARASEWPACGHCRRGRKPVTRAALRARVGPRHGLRRSGT